MAPTLDRRGAIAPPVPGRLGPRLAIAGAVLLLVGTWMHPMNSDPNQPLAAFAEYAAAPHWVASHVLQLLGVTLIVAALLLLARRLITGRAADWTTLAAGAAVTSLAVAAALQAVDGIALKPMVVRWAAASGQEKAEFFAAALAVRHIEIGLAAVTSLLFGVTAMLFGVAILIDGRLPRWLAGPALAGGVPTAAAGLVIANEGFSDLAMTVNLPANLVLIAWLVALGIVDWERAAKQ
jgi:hypothetical protein